MVFPPVNGKTVGVIHPARCRRHMECRPGPLGNLFFHFRFVFPRFLQFLAHPSIHPSCPSFFSFPPSFLTLSPLRLPFPGLNISAGTDTQSARAIRRLPQWPCAPKCQASPPLLPKLPRLRHRNSNIVFYS